MTATTPKPGTLALRFIGTLHPTTGRAFVTSDASLAMASAVPDAERDLNDLMRDRDECIGHLEVTERQRASLAAERKTLLARNAELVAALRELEAVTPDVPRANATAYHIRIHNAKAAARAALAAAEGKEAKS